MPPLGKDFDDVFSEFYDEDDPVITDDQIELIGTVYEIAQEELDRVVPMDGPADDCETLIMRRRIQRVARLIKLSSKAQKSFLTAYPKWKKLRKENISLLSDAGNTINNDRKNCNISKIVGSSVALVGGGVLVASAVMAPFTFGLTAPLAVAGGVATGLGNATTLGTSVTEMVLLNKTLNKAKEILKEDKENYKMMEDWAKRSQELVTAIEDIIEFSLMKKMIKDFKKYFDMFRKVQDKFYSSELKNVIGKAVTHLLRNPRNPRMLSSQVAFVQQIPIIVSLVFAAFLIRPENHLIFVAVMLTVRVASGVCALLDVGVDGTCAALALARGGSTVSKSVGRAVAQGTLAAVGMAIDVAMIVVASVDIHGGSKCKQAQDLLDVAKKLEEEMHYFGDVYSILKSDLTIKE